MVIHTLVKACAAERTLHLFTSNILETSMIAFFIAISKMAIPECNECIASGRMGLTLMKPVMLLPHPGIWFTMGAWGEYIKIMELVLDAQEELLRLLSDPSITCKGYWDEWGT